MKEYSLPGVRSYDISLIPDERGFFAEALRKDWQEFADEWIVQSNLSYSYPGMVRAWHKHVRGQVDYFLVLQGALKICAFQEEARSLVEIIASAEKPAVTRIPGTYWHGYKAIGNQPSMIIYFVNRLYDYNSPDEVRRPWNDSGIVPAEINGSKNDPRAGKPWDWFYPPHK